ncbi:amidohydrolase [Brevibacillus reuszeri]|uniref:amidohydrolase n=1 Tax=Brevibacillus reuszeri TaxID=54915 RepID=UPI000CCC6360|nr:amidohydrolase [Brevibacillus reuszeri]
MAYETLLKQAEAIHDQVIAWRRYLHQYPEVSFAEKKTSHYIEMALKSIPNLVVTRPTPTSVMARLIGKQPGKTLAIRADIDALPIQEENDFPFVSQNAGAMHACGHDGHTAMLLGAASVLATYQDSLEGEIRFLFQHAEELPPGGAEEMIEAGVMDGVDWVIGAHLQSPVETGKVGVITGPMLTSPDTFTITLHGKGGHAAEPHRTVDTIAIGALVVTGLQHMVSRVFNPVDPLVVSVTKFIGGHTHNVIPGSVELSGTVRCMNSELRRQVPDRMKQIVEGIAQSYDATAEMKYMFGYRPVINHEEVTRIVEETAVELFGEKAVYRITPSMAADDFSAFQNKAAGTYFNIGAGNQAQGIVHPHHHPKFTIDEASLTIGVKMFVVTAAKMLGLKG